MSSAQSIFIDQNDGSIPIHLLTSQRFSKFKASLSSAHIQILDRVGFSAKKDQLQMLFDDQGELSHVLFGLGKHDEARKSLSHAELARRLPKGTYCLEGEVEDVNLSALAWGLGAYQFSRYKKMRDDLPQLILPKGADAQSIKRAVDATHLVRDLINTPTSDMGPEHLEQAFLALGSSYNASTSVVKGDDLLAQNFPMIHAVGRASVDAPRLLELNWGSEDAPKLTLVGKGVCYDTGGLSIKPTSSMVNMKKDMGGAAHVMGLAQMIMDAKLPVSLQVLIPAVENSISSNAYRPGDILESRKGLSVEIGNTDAEGRLVLADALCYGDERQPDLMIDFATLTGAARVAMGPEVAPYFCEDQALALEINQASLAQQDPVWPLPMWHSYSTYLKSKIADINHIGNTPFAGTIIAALFLNSFVEHAKSYVHLDVFGWSPENKPWCPIGGEAVGIRTLFEVIEKRYGKG